MRTFLKFRAKRLQKQNDKLQLQLNEAKSIARELRSQVIEGDEFKVSGVDSATSSCVEFQD